MTNWTDNIITIKTVLKSLSVYNNSGKFFEPDEAFLRLKDITCNIRDTGKTIYLIGNGASASMASHISADLAKNAQVHTQVFTDLSLITAISNDIGYEDVFAEPLRRRMRPGDMLVAISSSGQSVNVLKAVQEAAALGGVVVTLSAMKPDNALRLLGNLNFYVPAQTYGKAETCHAAILHFWIDQMVERNP